MPSPARECPKCRLNGFRGILADIGRDIDQHRTHWRCVLCAAEFFDEIVDRPDLGFQQRVMRPRDVSTVRVRLPRTFAQSAPAHTPVPAPVKESLPDIVRPLTRAIMLPDED